VTKFSTFRACSRPFSFIILFYKLDEIIVAKFYTLTLNVIMEPIFTNSYISSSLQRYHLSLEVSSSLELLCICTSTFTLDIEAFSALFFLSLFFNLSSCLNRSMSSCSCSTNFPNRVAKSKVLSFCDSFVGAFFFHY